MLTRLKVNITHGFIRVIHFLENCLEALFKPELEKNLRLLSWLWLVGIYLLGIFFWGRFLGWGKVPLDYHDWANSYVPRIMAVQEALQTGTVPLHLTSSSALDSITDRFFATADVITTPEMVLMLFLSVDQYILVQTLLLLSLSTAGLLWLRRHYRLSLFAYSVMFFLFNFSGYVQAHIGAGHAVWWVYFLFPLFMVLVVQFLERKLGWRWVAALSFLLFYMVLLGGYHHFVWLLLFLGVLGLVCYDRLKWILAAGLAAGCLSAVRLLPPVLAFSNFRERIFLGGYPSLYYVWSSMVTILWPGGGNWNLSGVQGPWEYDLYVGLLGAIFLLYFGVYRWYKNQAEAPDLAKLALPALTLLVFSVGDVYALVRKIPIPLLAGERLVPRLIAVSFTVVVITAAIFFQRWLDQQELKLAKIGFLGLLVMMYFDFSAHAKIWNVAAFRSIPVGAPIAIAANYLANHPDPTYIRILLGGLALTVLTAAFLFFMAWRESRLARRRP